MHPELYLLPAGKLIFLSDFDLSFLFVFVPTLMMCLDLFGLRGVAIASPAFDTEGLEVGFAVVLEND